MTPGQVWLNAASEGPIPQVSAAALQEAAGWKLSPELLTLAKFQQIPVQLKQVLGRLLNAPADEIILGNSATYGLHLLANGLPLKAGDEVVLMCNDFPSDILPWLHLKAKGIKVRQLKSAGPVLSPAELEAALNSNTRVVCLPHVHSFSGWSLDIKAIAGICHRRGIVCVANLSQSAGVLEIDLKDLPVDAVVCAGYKWLLGPYSTGFCWMKSQLRQTLDYPQAYWTVLMDAVDLQSTEEISLKDDRSSRRYDVFAPANFFNYVPWRVSIEYLLHIGLPQVQQHNQMLVAQIIDGLRAAGYEVLGPRQEGSLSPIVVYSHKNPVHNRRIHEHLKERGVHTAFWKNNVRLAPHIYNTGEDIRCFLSYLPSAASFAQS